MCDTREKRQWNEVALSKTKKKKRSKVATLSSIVINFAFNPTTAVRTRSSNCYINTSPAQRRSVWLHAWQVIHCASLLLHAFCSFLGAAYCLSLQQLRASAYLYNIYFMHFSTLICIVRVSGALFWLFGLLFTRFLASEYVCVCVCFASSKAAAMACNKSLCT